MLAVLGGFFAALALALGAIGIYGILAYRVSRRQGEIGVRMALGAERRDVLWMVLRETLLLVASGAAAGMPAALVAARLVRSELYGMKASDPVTLAASGVVLVAVGALAGYLPARRAASVDPARALRSE